ncbi:MULTISPECIES: UDP-glucose 4-epimerase [Paraburkholderia]|uniref:UDP-glucose 4-epimerase n=1 Tax=Paraburkholderia madseniana TaxID=2599607 RepID=A0A6N6WEX2_9BURK|nr:MULTISPECIES: UDP-glucose 4-epimerase [Paraburkholderia]KAE8759212.1 UDP-glucose 4-epimerase [Paraburkholderia madseniana]MCX4145126.1 UDP-glucose 4-epimerase [Paraburkholderia madseniana]MDN7148077.1 UDP-glucose 4-epimerase [Paraburkholderia sp. WS6]MDQ6406957.1 UDP-glucose 4-epimerase [Paraburkholderia madseniana]
MTISGNVCENDWSVSVVTHQVSGGFDCSIQLSHNTPEGVFTHAFTHSSIYSNEREAVLAGLREGIVWVQLKMSKTLSVQPRESSVEPE